MPPLYATYDQTTVSRVIRWKVDGRYCLAAIWDPPTGFSGPRPTYVYENGGARQRKRALWLGNAETAPGVYSTPGMLTNDLGAYVVVVSLPPGGIDFEAAEETGQEYGADWRLSAAIAAAFLRGNYANPAVFGTAYTASPLRRHWFGAGDSAGACSQLGGQLIPRGELGELVEARAMRGRSKYRIGWDHTFGHFWYFQGQNRLEQFHELVVDSNLPDDEVGTYVLSGSVALGGSLLPVSGDSLAINRGNRLRAITATSYVASGDSTGATSLQVSGSSEPIPQGAWLRFNVSGTDYEHLVVADFAGGSGSVSIVGSPLEVDVPASTAIEVVVQFAVTSDFAGGAGNVGVWPAAEFPLASGAVLEFVRDNAEGYGEFGWSVGYPGTASDGRPWRSDHASGRGVPLEEKLDAGLGRLTVPNNPRLLELNLFVSGAHAESMHRIDSLTHPRSFWTRRNQSTPAALPEFISLHDEADAAELSHRFHLAGSTNVHAYLGNRRSNPSGTDPSLPWLKGRNAGGLPDLIKAFLTDPNRVGGSFA